MDIKHLAILKQIDLPSNDIPSSKDNPSDLKIDDDILNKSQASYQCLITPSYILGRKIGDEKVRRGKKKRDNEKHQGDKREAIRKRGAILEINVY